ncbi:hypothetical protein PTKIN_Ptkin13bG0208300 [Pterospermum kingtungense]
MECKKFAFVFAVMAVVLLATVTPIAFAARNEIGSFTDNTNAITNIRNPLANIFVIGNNPAQNCISAGGFCLHNPMNCCGNCGCLIIPGICVGSGC